MTDSQRSTYDEHLIADLGNVRVAQIDRHYTGRSLLQLEQCYVGRWVRGHNVGWYALP
jgi:hypothetical protein